MLQIDLILAQKVYKIYHGKYTVIKDSLPSVLAGQGACVIEIYILTYEHVYIKICYMYVVISTCGKVDSLALRCQPRQRSLSLT